MFLCSLVSSIVIQYIYTTKIRVDDVFKKHLPVRDLSLRCCSLKIADLCLVDLYVPESLLCEQLVV